MRRYLSTIYLLLNSSIAWAEIQLPAVFSDGAVLQCEADLPVWGWADAGSTVTVQFAGQTATTTVTDNGTWKLTLQPVAASYQKHTMRIEVDTESLQLTDILVGEVWLCSGQSNMESTLDFLSTNTVDPGFESVVAFITNERNTTNDEFLRHIKVPRKANAENAELNFNGAWKHASPQNNGQFSAAAYFFGKELRKHLDRPVGLLNSSWGGKRIEPFIPPSQFGNYDQILEDARERIQNHDAAKAEQDYQQVVMTWQEAGSKGRQPRKPAAPSLRSPGLPTSLYNGMIHPLVPYAMRGAIWYQGEANTRTIPEKYGALLNTLVKGWRQEWQQGDFPFYFCQLAAYTAPLSDPLQNKDPWVTVCHQMFLSTNIPNTGMVVLNDVGQVKDIHPRNKVDVGLRLSKWALNSTYGLKEIVASGPHYRSYEKRENTIVLTFDHSGSGLMVGKKTLLEPTQATEEPLGGFQICGEDREWKWASAKIISNNEVEAFHPSIPQPRAVRYAWQPNPIHANLYNQEGLPTSLFSTEAE
ncbi:MAG TPA: 9-O-acetylesterase [Opitutae bacterium]|nr:9-O-acetylesterase [Opitutae bacterium]